MAMVLELTSLISTRAACSVVARRARLRPSAPFLCAQSLSFFNCPPPSSSAWTGASPSAVSPSPTTSTPVRRSRNPSAAASQSSGKLQFCRLFPISSPFHPLCFFFSPIESEFEFLTTSRLGKCRCTPTLIRTEIGSFCGFLLQNS